MVGPMPARRPIARVLFDEAHGEAWTIRPEIARAMQPSHPEDSSYSLAAGQQRRAARHRALPARVGRVREHEHVGLLQRARVQRPGEVRHDVDVARAQRSRGVRVGGVLGVRRLDRAGDLGADRPRLAVRLVEQDRGDRAACGHRTHQ